MSIALIVSEGFGNGSLLGQIAKIVTMGYDISTIIPPTVPTATGISGAGVLGNGISGKGSTGNGIMANQKTGSGISGPGRL